MSTAGRKTRFDVDALFNVFEQEKSSIVNDRGQLQKPSHPCWVDIAEKCGQGISSKYLYTIILDNRFKIREKLNLTLASDKKGVSTEEDPSHDDANNSSTDDESIVENRLTFQITLSNQEWEHLYSTTDYFRGDRCVKSDHKILKPFKWSSVINEHFYELTKRTCCLIFKRCKITPNGTRFLRLEGECKSCKSILRGVVDDPPKPNSRVVINCTYDGDYHNCFTQRKRRILGENKEDYLRRLMKENKTASFIQKEDAARIMNYGDAVPSHLPTLNSLRIMKCRSKMESRLDDDPILAILCLKSSLPFNDMIRDVGYDHFYVHYWSTFQLNTYRTYCRKNPISCISIDATGSVVTPMNLFSGRKTKSIFLYEIAVLDTNNEVQFSAAEMLSEDHDNNAIAYWISRWLVNKIPPPKIVVTDMSLALMMGCAKALTQYTTLKKYLAVCWSLLQDKDCTEIPYCMIRNDFAHTIHLMSGWPEIKYVDSSRVRKFYLRSLALVIGCTEWREARQLIKHIFIICLSETEGLNDDGLTTPCQLSIEYLKSRVSGISPALMEQVDAEEIVDEPEKIDDEINFDEEFSDSQIRNLYESCVSTAEETSGDRINPFYKPKIAQRLLKMCDLLPCWSAIMVPVFDYGQTTHTTAASESLFKEIKVDGFQHEKLPMRADEFVEKHLNFLSGATTLAGAKYKNVDPQKLAGESFELKDKEEEETSIKWIENEEEDWRGLNSQEKLTPRKRTQPTQRSPETIKNVDPQKLAGESFELEDKEEETSIKWIENEEEDWRGLNSKEKLEPQERTQPNQESPERNENLDPQKLAGESFELKDTDEETSVRWIETELIGESFELKDKEEEASIKWIENEEEDQRGLNSQEKLEPQRRTQPKQRSPKVSQEEVVATRQTATKKVKKNYLVPDPSIIFQPFTKTKCPVMGLIKNGNRAEVKSVKVGEHEYTITNTCAFDTLVQILFTSYADSSEYATFIERHSSKLLFFELIKNGVRDGVTVQLYRKRAQILSTILCDSVKKQIQAKSLNINLSANTTTNYLLEEIFQTFPSVIEKRNCPTCTGEQERRDNRLIVNLVTNNLTFLLDTMRSRFDDPPNCDLCGRKVPQENRHIELSNHLFIEPAPSLDYFRKEPDLRTKLGDVPTQFNLCGRRYFLRGVVHFDRPWRARNFQTIGHYIAYCFRQDTNSWQKYDDLTDKPKIGVRPSTVVSAQGLIYTI